VGFLLDTAYVVLAAVCGPFYLAWRLIRRKPMASPWRRLGFVDPGPEGPGPVVWFHAVSVGEVLAIRGLLADLQAGLPGARPVITSTTVTGLATARRTWPSLPVRESPLDLGTAVRRFLRRMRPDVLVLVELELWPNLLGICARRGIPVVVVNGKLSPGSLRGYRRLGRLLPRFLQGVCLWMMQDATYAGRLAGLGVPEDRIRVTGSIKYANATLDDPGPERQRLRLDHGWAEEARVCVAGSTHAGEEVALLDAFRALRAKRPEWRLVLAPRHPERVAEVAALVTRAGWRLGRRSRPGHPPDPDVLLVDTMGELRRLYALGDVAFVGGTLVPVGGHNLLEPAGWGLPILVGPHLDTVRETASDLDDAGVVSILGDSAGLARRLEEVLGDPSARRRAADGARRTFAARQGAALRTWAGIRDTLEGPRPPT
jgi:3-deoxy-D-manno-octulosonic-acid transferase